MLRKASAGARHDVLLLTRGGGSLEDLMAFSDEAVARAVHASAIPVVSAVGHEIDFSISDFVADLRAATPSAAAELLVPDAQALRHHLGQQVQRLHLLQRRRLQAQTQRVDHLLARLQAQRPQARLARDGERLAQLHRRLHAALREQTRNHAMRVDRLHARLLAQHPRQLVQTLHRRLAERERSLQRCITHRIERARLDLKQSARALHTVSPLATLERGYAIVFDSNGRVLRSATNAPPGTPLRAHLADGELPLRVLDPDTPTP
jgi:exodeoxyribonuclease VII large subunit